MPAYSVLDLAYDVLKTSMTPLTYQEIWQEGKLAGLTEKIRTSGKTPWDSMGSQLYIEVRNNIEHSRFFKVGKRPAILYPARRREALDWETINKLCEQNRDFEKFLQDVKIDFESRRLHRSEYDEVHKEIKGYIRSKLNIDVLE